MTYRERATGRTGAVLWSSTGASGPILPDGCLDLIWADGTLIVAGPDTTARHHHEPGRRRYVGLRFSRGLGPRLLGVPADAVVDTSPDLADLWGARRAGLLRSRVDDDPEAGLLGWLAEQHVDDDPFGVRVAAGLARGLSVAAVADRLGCTARTLHRRSRPVFGYGPQHLARVLRLQRALGHARGGRPWAETAALAGYVDQAHLARDVRALTGVTPTRLVGQGPSAQSGANRSTGEPSGSCTTA